MKGHTKNGFSLWERDDHTTFYYWLDDKQGYPSGSVLAMSERDARKKILLAHTGSKITGLLDEETYHN